jgi:hypothetical protein
MRKLQVANRGAITYAMQLQANELVSKALFEAGYPQNPEAQADLYGVQNCDPRVPNDVLVRAQQLVCEHLGVEYFITESP